MRFVLMTILLLPSLALSQMSRSDFEIKSSFEYKKHNISETIASARSTATLDSLSDAIDALAAAYSPHRVLLDKALYPETFGTAIALLQREMRQTRDRVFLIETQGARIDVLEMELAGVIRNLDSLSVARNSILTELARLKKSNGRLQETIKRLSANLEARDQLIFALIDTVFEGYNVPEAQAGEVRSNALNHRLGKVNALERIYDVAANSIHILEELHPEGKDYTPLLAQYVRFKQRWLGLRERLNAAYASATPSGKKGVSPPPNPGAEVDSLVAIWDSRLLGSFWSGLNAEFTANDIPIHPFHDVSSFTENVTGYVDSMKAGDRDASGFVVNVWKNRIDREWRESLSLEGVMGRTEYASLDKKVSELGEKKVDAKFIVILGILLVLLAITWVMLSRKKTTPVIAQPASAPPENS